MVIRARLVSAPRRRDAATFVLVGSHEQGCEARWWSCLPIAFVLKRIGDSFKYNTRA